jgi:AraC-like DNA-binding protein
LVSPATTAVGIVVKLNDSDWRPPEFLIGARDFCIRSRIPVGDSAHPNMQQWLTPLGAYRLLGGVPMDALSGRVVDLTDVLGTGIRPWPTSCARHRAGGNSSPCWTTTCCGAPRTARSPHQRSPGRGQRLVVAGGRLPIRQLAVEVGWSHKHLITRFKQQVGLPPKTAARLVRFDAVWRRLATRPPARWDQVTAECGYADQAHLIRDFRRFTGACPTEFPTHPQAGPAVR